MRRGDSMSEDDIIERTVTIKNIDPEVCRDVLYGFVEKDGTCRVKIIERKSKPGVIEIVKLTPE